MADYYVYNREHVLLGMIQNAFSVQWLPRYSESGKAEFHVQDNKDNLEMLKIGNVIVNKNRNEVCFIDYVMNDAQTNGGEIMASGSLNPLKMRINRNTVNIKSFNDLRDCLQANLRGLDLQIGKGVDVKVNETESTWDNLEEMILEFCSSYHVGFKVRFDSNQIPLKKSPYIFDFYVGEENHNVKFSEELGTIISQNLMIDDSSSANFAYIAGAGEGADRKVVELDLTNGKLRREIYVDARDLDDFYDGDESKPIPESEYKQMLLDRGRRDLSENATNMEYSVEIDTFNGIFKYGRDYELGDLCMTDSTSFEIQQFMRVSGLDIVDEQSERIDVILSSERS